MIASLNPVSPFLLPEGPEIRVSFDGHRRVDLAVLLPAVFLYLELPHSVKCSNVKSAADEEDERNLTLDKCRIVWHRCLAAIRERFTGDLEAEPIFARKWPESLYGTGICTVHFRGYEKTSTANIRTLAWKIASNMCGLLKLVSFVSLGGRLKRRWPRLPRRLSIALPAGRCQRRSGSIPLNLGNDTILELADGGRPRQPEAS
jgi:hypothetical protein